jgi:hypothetical protein
MEIGGKHYVMRILSHTAHTVTHTHTHFFRGREKAFLLTFECSWLRRSYLCNHYRHLKSISKFIVALLHSACFKSLTANPFLRYTESIHALELIVGAVCFRAAMCLIGKIIAVVIAV